MHRPEHRSILRTRRDVDRRTDAKAIIATAKENADEITVRANQARKQIIAAANMQAAKIASDFAASASEFAQQQRTAAR
jgi:hypothetical protein